MALPAVASYKQQQLAVSYTRFVNGVTKQHWQAHELMQHLLPSWGQHKSFRTDAAPCLKHMPYGDDETTAMTETTAMIEIIAMIETTDKVK